MNERVSQSAYARSRTPSVSRQYINKLIKEGKISVDEKKRVDPVEADQVLQDLADPAHDMREGNEPPEQETVDEAEYDEPAGNPSGANSGLYRKARTQQVAYQAKMAELDYRKKANELVDVDDVERSAFDAARQTRDALLSVPQEVAGVLVGMTDEREIAAFLRGKLRDALMEASDNVRPSVS